MPPRCSFAILEVAARDLAFVSFAAEPQTPPREVRLHPGQRDAQLSGWATAPDRTCWSRSSAVSLPPPGTGGVATTSLRAGLLPPVTRPPRRGGVLRWHLDTWVQLVPRRHRPGPAELGTVGLARRRSHGVRQAAVDDRVRQHGLGLGVYHPRRFARQNLIWYLLMEEAGVPREHVAFFQPVN